MLRSLLAIVCAASLLIAGAAAADWTEGDVRKVQDAVKQGKNVSEHGALSQKQVVEFDVGPVNYVIDLRAQLCFAQGRWAIGGPSSVTVVPCASLKKGYPLIAPLITWEQ